MDDNFSPKVRDVIAFSKEEALRLGHEFIGTEHLLLGLIRKGEGKAMEILTAFDVDTVLLRKKLEQLNPAFTDTTSKKSLHLTRQAEKALKTTFLEAKLYQSESIDTAHLLLCILRNENDPTTKLLEKMKVDYDSVKEQFKSLLANDDDYIDMPSAEDAFTGDDKPDKEEPSKENLFGNAGVKTNKKSKTPVLDNFGRDLTEMADLGKLDPVVGRDAEIQRVSQILSRRKKNNPLLIGEPGVGKSAIAEGLALRIVQRKVSRILYDKRVVTLDLASLVAGTKYRGQFEERMKALMNELEKNKDIILFIDEIHTIVGAGGATGSLDASNMFKPALARGEIQCVGATTLDEYRQYIEKDGALERRFQKVLVEPTSVEETIEILENIKEKYEEHHNVTYTKEALEACVKLTNRYMTDRFLPDKAIDALDEAGSRVHIININVPKKILELEQKLEEVRELKNTVVKKQKYEEAAKLRDDEKNLEKELISQQEIWENDSKLHRETVDQDNVAEVVSMMSGVPVNRIAQTEINKLAELPELIKGKVIGQNDAVNKVVKAIQRNRAGLKDPNKPIGSFIFLGQTGVGKTQLAKVLAKELFDNENSLIRIDMSEYMEKFAISRLVGAPPGYVGYEEGGQLTEKIRRKPYSVVLLDEIEKAHPEVFNLLLQVMDHGTLTDNNGRKADFRNVILIMTTNAGSQEMSRSSMGFAKQDHKSDGMEALKNLFTPEFRNRLDSIIQFRPLGTNVINTVVDKFLCQLQQQLDDKRVVLEVDQEAREWLALHGYDEKMGARPMQRLILEKIKKPLSEQVLFGSLANGGTIKVFVENDDIQTETETETEIEDEPLTSDA